MTPAEHYVAAEVALAEAAQKVPGHTVHTAALAVAQIHATLATVQAPTTSYTIQRAGAA